MSNNTRRQRSASRTPTNDHDLEITTNRVAQLTESMNDVADIFFFWKREGPKFQVTKYKEDFDSISEVIDRTCTAFVQTVQVAEKESQSGMHISAEVIDLIGQLLDENLSRGDLQDLITHLLKKVDRLKQAAERLQTEFSDIRGGFFWTKEQEVSLAVAVNNYRDRRVTWKKKFLAAVTPPVSSGARAFRDTADPEKRMVASTADLNLLDKTREGLDRAISITTLLVDDWAMLSSTIQNASSDDLYTAKKAILKLQRRQWTGIREQYERCGSRARVAHGRLQVKDATKDTLRIPSGSVSVKPQDTGAPRGGT